MHCFIVFPFFLKYLTIAEYIISSWPVVSKSTLMIPINFLCIRSKLWQQDVGYNFVCSWQMWYAIIITTVCSITLLINRYNDWLHPLFRQFLLIWLELISLWMSDWIVLPSALINSAGIWSVPGDLCLFSFTMAISTSKALGWGTSGSAVCITVSLASLTPSTFSSWEKWFLHQAQILWESVTKSPFSAFTILRGRVKWKP